MSIPFLFRYCFGCVYCGLYGTKYRKLVHATRLIIVKRDSPLIPRLEITANKERREGKG